MYKDRTDRLGVMMSGQAHKDILLADVDQLAEEIIRKKGVAFQFSAVRITAAHPREGTLCHIVFRHLHWLDSSQAKPVKLVGSQG